MDSETKAIPASEAPAVKIHPTTKLREDVAQYLADSGPKVRQIVVDQLTQAEITKRTNSVLTVLGKIDEKTRELRKLQDAGKVVYNRSGEKVGEPTFEKKELEEIKKVQEVIVKWQSALTLAFEESNFQKLHEIAKEN